MITIVVAASVALNAAVDPATVSRGAVDTQTPATECIQFRSPEKLPVGTPFRAALLNGLEFRLSADWGLSVGPAGEPEQIVS